MQDEGFSLNLALKYVRP